MSTTSHSSGIPHSTRANVRQFLRNYAKPSMLRELHEDLFDSESTHDRGWADLVNEVHIELTGEPIASPATVR